MTPPIPPVPSCPLLDAKIVEAGARASRKTARARSSIDLHERTSRAVLTAAVAALDRDELVRIAEEAVLASARKRGYHGNYLEAWPLRNDARAVLAAIGLLPAEDRMEPT